MFKGSISHKVSDSSQPPPKGQPPSCSQTPKPQPFMSQFCLFVLTSISRPIGYMVAAGSTLSLSCRQAGWKLLVATFCRQLCHTATEPHCLGRAPGVEMWALLLGNAWSIPSHPMHSQKAVKKHHAKHRAWVRTRNVTDTSSLQVQVLVCSCLPDLMLPLFSSDSPESGKCHGRDCCACRKSLCVTHRVSAEVQQMQRQLQLAAGRNLAVPEAVLQAELLKTPWCV